MHIPKTMSAIVVSEPGGPDALILDDNYPVPEAAPGQALIKVAAAGLNRADILQRQGKYKVPKNASPLIGLEVSGLIAKATKNFNVGDRVVALCNGGGYADYVAVPEGQILPLPKSYTLTEGAALPETFFTVQQTLFNKAGLGADMNVLIHGGSGGIGATALQMGALAGATMIATVSNDTKSAYAKSMGASHTINYQDEDFVARNLELTGGMGAHIILDVVGGDYLSRNLKALANNGTIIQLAIRAGAKAEISLAHLLGKSATLIGTLLRPVSDAGKAKIAKQLYQNIWPALEDGRMLKPNLKTYLLSDVAAAHAQMDSPDHQGKIVLLSAFGQTTRE